MKNLTIIIAVILLSSCCRWIPQKCITNSVDTLITVRTDTIVVYKDTTIYLRYYIPGKVIIDSISYPVYISPNGLVNSDSLFLDVPLAKAWAVVQNSILKGKLVQKDTVLILSYRLRNALRQTTILKDSIVVVKENTTILEKQTTKLKFIFAGIISILLLVLFINWSKK